ncbi:MAG TPA: DedA family protein [Thermoplasmata archaeon]
MVSLPIIETVFEFLTTYMAAGGLLALFALMAVESFGIPPLPSEIILPFAGFLVWKGTYSGPEAVAAALAGGLLGAYAAYAVGRWGRGTLERPTGFLRLDPKHLASMDRWFNRHGEGTVLVARLLPIVRSYISYPAGSAKMEPVRFGVYSLVGATPFTIALIYAGFVLGRNYTAILPYFQIADLFAAAGVLVILVYVTLRWRRIIGPGFPPKLTRRGGSPPPVGGGTPSTTDPVSPRP